jgi:hypothetical protein
VNSASDFSINQETHHPQIRLAAMASHSESLKEQLTKTDKQLEKTESLLQEERSVKNKSHLMNEDYSNWVPDPRDVRFDESWRLIIVIAFLLPITLGSLFLWTIFI